MVDNIMGSFMCNYFKFGPVAQEEVSFKKKIADYG